MNEYPDPETPGDLDYVISQLETISRQQAETVSNLRAISESIRNISAVATLILIVAVLGLVFLVASSGLF